MSNGNDQESLSLRAKVDSLVLFVGLPFQPFFG